MKSDRRQLRVHRSAKRNIRVSEGERKGEIAPKEFNINIVHAQTAWIPQPSLGDASPTTTWSPFPREKTRPPPRPSPPPLPNNHVIGIPVLVSPSPGRPPPPSPSPPLLTGSDRHRHHRGAIAIAAKTNKTRRKAVANVAGGGRSGRKRI